MSAKVLKTIEFKLSLILTENETAIFVIECQFFCFV